METQFEVPKLIGAFLLGNLCFALYLSREIHRAIGILHFVFASSVVLTGFGGMQLYPFAYWTAALFFSLWALSQEEYHHLFLWKLIALSGLCVSAHAYLQMMGFTWPLHYAEGIEASRPIAFMGQQTKLGAFLAPCAASALALGWLPACAFISLVALATKSSFTAFSLVVGLAVVHFQRRGSWPKWASAGLICGGLLIVLGPHFLREKIPAFDDHGRRFVYRDTINAWKERPLFGYGAGSFKALFAGPNRSKIPLSFEGAMQSQDAFGWGGGWFEQTHLDYLQGLFEFGLYGFAAILFAVFSLLHAYVLYYRNKHYYWDIRRTQLLAAQGALASILVDALGNFPWLLSPIFMIGVLGAAILLRATRA